MSPGTLTSVRRHIDAKLRALIEKAAIRTANIERMTFRNLRLIKSANNQLFSRPVFQQHRPEAGVDSPEEPASKRRFATHLRLKPHGANVISGYSVICLPGRTTKLTIRRAADRLTLFVEHRTGEI